MIELHPTFHLHIAHSRNHILHDDHDLPNETIEWYSRRADQGQPADIVARRTTR